MVSCPLNKSSHFEPISSNFSPPAILHWINFALIALKNIRLNESKIYIKTFKNNRLEIRLSFVTKTLYSIKLKNETIAFCDVMVSKHFVYLNEYFQGSLPCLLNFGEYVMNSKISHPSRTESRDSYC